jgi:hypothetical protein
MTGTSSKDQEVNIAAPVGDLARTGNAMVPPHK